MKGDAEHFPALIEIAKSRRDALVDGGHAREVKGAPEGSAHATGHETLRLWLSYGELELDDVQSVLESVVASGLMAIMRGGVPPGDALAGAWTDGILMGLGLARLRAEAAQEPGAPRRTGEGS